MEGRKLTAQCALLIASSRTKQKGWINMNLTNNMILENCLKSAAEKNNFMVFRICKAKAKVNIEKLK